MSTLYAALYMTIDVQEYEAWQQFVSAVSDDAELLTMRKTAEPDLFVEGSVADIMMVEDTLGNEKEKWFTHMPNRAAKLDRTIDYFLYSENLVLLDKYVRQHDTLRISDHLPVVAVFQLPL